jgi:uncharacterized protein (DUF1015 family)
MPVIRPFRAWRYAPQAGALADLLAPPYDVISPAGQDAFYARHPHNLIRLELGREVAGDDAHVNRYTRAAGSLTDWRAQGIITRDRRPAFYVYQQAFVPPSSSETCTRTGLLGSLRLAPWGDGIRPHEQTFPGAKADRLALLEHTQLETGAIFTFCHDATHALRQALLAVTSAAPLAAFGDDDGVQHRLWCLDDPGLLTDLRQALAGETLYVADGHHRYETALNYQRQMGSGGGSEPWDYVLVYVTPQDDPGLRILAAHRCLHDVPGLTADAALAVLHGNFEIEAMAELQALQWQLAQAAPGAGRFGLLLAGQEGGRLLHPRPGLSLASSLPAALTDLDVVKLREWALQPLLSAATRDLADKRFIAYDPDVEKVIETLAAGAYQAALLLNPTTLDQLCVVADAGAVMPQKATYFYPKLISGIVMHDVVTF